MKTLYIIRHGKSAWDDPALKDHERILLPKGIKRTKKVASFLSKKDIKPDLIISSFAQRALETAFIIAKSIEYPEKNIQIDQDIYYQESEYLMELLYRLSNEINSVMLFGHNPTFTSFANKFLEKPISFLPTTGTVSVSFETDKWEEINMARKITNFVVTPKML